MISIFSESKRQGFQTPRSAKGSQFSEHSHSEKTKRLCTTYAVALSGYAHEKCLLPQSGVGTHFNLSENSKPLPQVTDCNLGPSMLDASNHLVYYPSQIIHQSYDSFGRSIFAEDLPKDFGGCPLQHQAGPSFGLIQKQSLSHL